MRGSATDAGRWLPRRGAADLFGPRSASSSPTYFSRPRSSPSVSLPPPCHPSFSPSSPLSLPGFPRRPRAFSRSFSGSTHSRRLSRHLVSWTTCRTYTSISAYLDSTRPITHTQALLPFIPSSFARHPPVYPARRISSQSHIRHEGIPTAFASVPALSSKSSALERQRTSSRCSRSIP